MRAKHIMIMTIFVVILSYSDKIHSSGLLLPWSARSAALNCCCLYDSSSGNVFGNPAGGGSDLIIGGTRLYNLSELQHYYLAGGYKIGQIRIGYGIEHLEHCSYTSTAQLANLSWQASSFRAGINVRSMIDNVSGYSLENAWSADLGMIWDHKELSGGISWLNVWKAKMERSDLPVYIVWEMNWKAGQYSLLGLRIEKETGNKFSPAVSGVQRICEELQILASYTHYPRIIGCGISISLSNISVDYGLQYHLELQETHFISIRYALVH